MFRSVRHDVDEDVRARRQMASERAGLVAIQYDDVRPALHKIGRHGAQAAMRNGHRPSVVEQMGRRRHADLTIPAQNKSVRHSFSPQYRG